MNAFCATSIWHNKQVEMENNKNLMMVGEKRTKEHTKKLSAQEVLNDLQNTLSKMDKVSERQEKEEEEMKKREKELKKEIMILQMEKKRIENDRKEMQGKWMKEKRSLAEHIKRVEAENLKLMQIIWWQSRDSLQDMQHLRAYREREKLNLIKIEELGQGMDGQVTKQKENTEMEFKEREQVRLQEWERQRDTPKDFQRELEKMRMELEEPCNRSWDERTRELADLTSEKVLGCPQLAQKVVIALSNVKCNGSQRRRVGLWRKILQQIKSKKDSSEHRSKESVHLSGEKRKKSFISRWLKCGNERKG
ncbi:hypothetical protein P4O66_004576 [Electrophorus voltai]|uniref:Uncharacterized protein n=1 Tax=Electrophorus voltai TaxID=2609070 RepID=A0AAD8ZMF3_9TELE|nr:hypothetical protein P4O66_004576 [Electrophorus voltai]